MFSSSLIHILQIRISKFLVSAIFPLRNRVFSPRDSGVEFAKNVDFLWCRAGTGKKRTVFSWSISGFRNSPWAFEAFEFTVKKKMNENRRNSNKFRSRKKETGVGNTIAMELWERRKALLKCLSYSKFQRAGERGSYAFKGYEGPIYLSKSKFEMHRIIGAIFNAHVTWNKLLSTSSPKRGKLSITKTFEDHFQRKSKIVWVMLPLIPIPYPAERHNAHK